jgi:hypothetical protein
MSNIKISALSSASTPLSGSEIIPLNKSGITDSVSVANLTAGRSPSMSGYTITDGTRQQTSNPSSSDNTIRFTNSSTYYWATGLSAPGVAGLNDAYYITHYNGSSWSLFWEYDNTGNMLQGIAGKGINFTANTPASGMTSQLLNWYEEGTWTPTDNSGAGLTFTVSSATYVKIGKIVYANLYITYPTTSNTSGAALKGLPFTTAGSNAGYCPAIVYTNASVGLYCATSQSSTAFPIYNSSTNANVTNATLSGKYLIASIVYQAQS